jgi:hypothetical protein
MSSLPPKVINGKEICGCYFGNGEGVILPGFCRREPYAPGEMCPYCDEAMFHRHCVVCGEPIAKFLMAPVEIRCQACESAGL